MDTIKEIELLDDATNMVVARYLERNFPGVLLQGDTLRILLSDIEELGEELEANDLEAVAGISEVIKEKLTDILSHYERVLSKNEFELPYMNPVNIEK